MSNENTPAEPEQHDSSTPSSDRAETDSATSGSDDLTGETSAAERPATETPTIETPATESPAGEASESASVEAPQIGEPEFAEPEIVEPEFADPDLDDLSLDGAELDDLGPEGSEIDDLSADGPEGDDLDGAGSASEFAESDYVPSMPPPAPAPPVRRLVRDPYAKLGGVASGVAHHYGIDVSLVRLGFILFTVFSGVGLVLYLLAWLIIPRAEYWPPAPPPEGRSFSSAVQGRELGYGLLAIGILLAIFAGGGDAARMLVSVGLVGAGIWMLVQPNTSRAGAVPEGSVTGGPEVTPTSQPPAAAGTEQLPASWQPVGPGDADAVSGTDDTMTSNLAGGTGSAVATATAPEGPTVYTTTQPSYVPTPVPPRRRRVWPFVLLLALLALPVLFIAGIVAVAVASGEGLTFDVDADNIVELTPLTLDDLPPAIDEGAGEIVIDLSQLDISTVDEADLPRSVDIDLNAGEVTIEVPEDLPVSVDASVGAGDVTVFDNSSDGIRPRLTVSEDDAVIDLDIRVGVGEVTVDH
jgi:phage shock protein PspC (stress-responsive transcriptional regulator)